MEFRSTGTVRHNLKFDALFRMELTVPSLEIQRECLRKLSSVETQIALVNSYVAKLDELVKSRFIEMFGDPENNIHEFQACTLGEVLSVQPGNGLYKPQKDYVTDGSGTPIVRIGSFEDRWSGTKGLKRAIGQASINQGDVKSLPIFLPPLELQQAFLAFACQVDKLEFAARQQIEKLQILYDSLAQEYFSSEGE